MKIIILFALMFVFVGCKKEDSPTDGIPAGCLTQLETAARCKAILPDCEGAGTGKSMTCIGKTNAGVRCSRTISDICGFCYQHVGQNDGRCPIETKNACGYCDEHTDQYKP